MSAPTWADFGWITGGGVIMSGLALCGSISLFLSPKTLQTILTGLIALAAGSLLGGALLHMVPEAIESMGNNTWLWVSFLGGFICFFILEQFVHYHHCNRRHHCTEVNCEHFSSNIEVQASNEEEGHHHTKKHLAWMVLIADGLHNFIGGLGVASAFLNSTETGIIAWIAAAAHEIPQELGDFGVLVHAGLKPKLALLLNLASALTFLIAGWIAYGLATIQGVNLTWLLPFAAGNFVYIAAADLIPEIHKDDECVHEGHKHTEIMRSKKHSIIRRVTHFVMFLLGVGILLVIRVVMEGLHHHH